MGAGSDARPHSLQTGSVLLGEGALSVYRVLLGQLQCPNGTYRDGEDTAGVYSA